MQRALVQLFQIGRCEPDKGKRNPIDETRSSCGGVPTLLTRPDGSICFHSIGIPSNSSAARNSFFYYMFAVKKPNNNKNMNKFCLDTFFIDYKFG